MAGIDFDIATGQIDRGDTKRFVVAVKDEDGNRLALDSLTLELEVDGEKTTYTLGDFSESNKRYTTKHTFENAGFLHVDVTATDDPNLDTERETDSTYIHP